MASFQSLSEAKRQERIDRDFIIVAWVKLAVPMTIVVHANITIAVTYVKESLSAKKMNYKTSVLPKKCYIGRKIYFQWQEKDVIKNCKKQRALSK